MAETSLFEDLVDQYKIERLLAEKRHTDLYRAYDVDEDRAVTLDVLRPPLSDDLTYSGRLLSRAKALAQIRHPNIPRIFDYGRTPSNQAYVAQALVEGYPLSQRLEQLIQRGAPANPIYALKLVRQLAEALLLAERLNFRHYDLQPQNVWLKNVAMPTDDTVLLLDLFMPPVPGSAMAEPASPAAGDFLSPEQRQGKEIEASSHVYSLGAILFALLAGQAPLGPVRLQEFVAQKLTSGPTALERLRAGLSPETYELVDRSLRSDSARRYPGAEPFLAALDSALAAEEVNVHPAPDVQRHSERRFLGLVISILVFALLVVAGFVAARGTPPRPSSTLSVTTTVIGSLGTISGTPDATPSLIATSVLVPGGAGGPGGEAPPSPTSTFGELAEETQVLPVVATEQPTATPTLTPTPTSTASPTAEPTTTPTPTTAVAQVRVLRNSVNVRQGPGLAFPSIGVLGRDEIVNVVARFGDARTGWLLVQLPDGGMGWLAVELAEPLAGLRVDALPTPATMPPTPVPSQTPTVTPSPAISPTALPPTPEDPGNGGGGPEPTEPPEPTDEPPPTDVPPPTDIPPTEPPPTRTPPPIGP